MDSIIAKTERLHRNGNGNGHGHAHGHSNGSPKATKLETEAMPKPPVDLARIEAAVREILLAVGEDPDRDGLVETPKRVAKAYAELFSGLRVDPRVYLKKTFDVPYEEMVVQRDIDFNSCCEHHLLPFMGKVHIAYIPNGRVVGLSKLARIVEAVSHRPQVQERMTEELADLLSNELDARGCGVVVEAVHSCMSLRGVRKTSTTCMTSAMRGTFKTNPATRAEFLSLIHSPRSRFGG